MGGKIPQPIRLEVIRKWLKGYSRDEIAKDTEIGAGTVTGIIRQCRQDDPDFDLLRGVALELKDQGMRVENFAPLFRLKRLLEEKEVQLAVPNSKNVFSEFKKFEAIIITLEVLCFKHSMPMDQVFERLRVLYSINVKIGTMASSLPDYVMQLRQNIENQKKKIKGLRLETKYEVERQGATKNLLQDYKASLSLFESTKRELEKVTKDRDSCRKELNSVRERHLQKISANNEEDYGWRFERDLK